MRLLDLFCGAGGAAMGYYRAGFAEIVGVDIRPQKNYPYPFTFVLGDALEYCAAYGSTFHAIHASPPCQAYANVTAWRHNGWQGERGKHPALIPATRDVLAGSGVPYVIENVRTLALHDPLMLCGSMFGIAVRRHRYFETNWAPEVLVPACCHENLLPFEHKAERAYADEMGCHWMTNREAREAVPPAYTELIGKQLLQHIRGEVGKQQRMEPLVTTCDLAKPPDLNSGAR